MRRTILSLLIIGLLALAACSQPQQSKTTAEMELVRWDAFTTPNNAVTKIHIERGKLTYTTFNREGEQTLEVEKNLSEQDYQNLVNDFKNANFQQQPNTINPDAQVADVGKGNITYKEDGQTKTVTIDPFYPVELSQGMQDIIDRFQDLQMHAMSMTNKEAEKMAEKWIKQSPTYAYDGYDLELENHHVLESFPEQHVLTYSFKSRHGGYGNRSGQMVTQVITPHNITVRIEQRKVVSAVIDNQWDEIEQKPLQQENMEVKYQPMQCQKTPWQEWYEEGNGQFVDEPSQVELIQAYYSSQGVEINNVEERQNEGAVCQACDVCPAINYYVGNPGEGSLEELQTDGWEQVNTESTTSKTTGETI